MRIPSDDFFRSVYKKKDPDLLRTLEEIQKRKKGSLGDIALQLEFLAPRQLDDVAELEALAKKPPPSSSALPDELARFASGGAAKDSSRAKPPKDLEKCAAPEAPAAPRKSLLDERSPEPAPRKSLLDERSPEPKVAAPKPAPEKALAPESAPAKPPVRSRDLEEREDEPAPKKVVAHHAPALARPASRSATAALAAAGLAGVLVLAGAVVLASRRGPEVAKTPESEEPANVPAETKPRNETETERRAHLEELAAEAVKAARAGASNLARERVAELEAKATSRDSELVANAEARVGQALAEARRNQERDLIKSGGSDEPVPSTAVLSSRPKPEAAPPCDVVLDASGLTQQLSTALKGVTGWDDERRKAAFAKLDETTETEATRLMAALLGAPRATRDKIAAVLAKVAKDAPAAVAKIPQDGSADEALKTELQTYVAIHVERVVRPAVLAAVRQVETEAAKDLKKLCALLRPEILTPPKKKPEKNAKPPENTWAKRAERNEKAFAALAAARKEALRVIFDLTIYPDEDHGRIGQPTVDEKVDAVKSLYPDVDWAVQDELARFVGVPEKEAKRRLDILDSARVRHALASPLLQTTGERGEVEFPTLGDEALLRYRAGKIDEAVAMIGSLTGFEAECLKRLRDQKVLEFNDSLAQAAIKDGVQPTSVEIEQVRITNDYRLTMGVRALEIDTRLVSSARGHCEEMNALNYFAHESPVEKNKYPSNRTANAGYDWPGVGENIAMGMESPLGAHMGWYNSSGHHRNILNDGWMAMGSGKDGRYWTQNFGARGRLTR